MDSSFLRFPPRFICIHGFLWIRVNLECDSSFRRSIWYYLICFVLQTFIRIVKIALSRSWWKSVTLVYISLWTSICPRTIVLCNCVVVYFLLVCLFVCILSVYVITWVILLGSFSFLEGWYRKDIECLLFKTRNICETITQSWPSLSFFWLYIFCKFDKIRCGHIFRVKNLKSCKEALLVTV